MSQLSPFVRAFRALAASCVETSKKVSKDSVERATSERAEQFGLELALLFGYFGSTFARAATDLEQQIARDLTRVGPMVDEFIYDGNLYRRDAADAFIKVGPAEQ